MSAPVTDDLLSPQDAAALAGVPAAQLLRWIAEQPRLRDGEAFRGPGIRYVGPRHRPRFRREDVEGWRDGRSVLARVLRPDLPSHT